MNAYHSNTIDASRSVLMLFDAFENNNQLADFRKWSVAIAIRVSAARRH